MLSWHGTTILIVRKGGTVVIGGDGQVSIGQTMVKSNAKKARKLGKGDVIATYIGAANKRSGPLAGNAATFELIKVAMRLRAMWNEPSAQVLQWLDDEMLPAALKDDTLRPAISEADSYCSTSKLRCDFVLQPMMYERRSHSGAEALMMQTLARVYPRIDVLTARMFADAMQAGPADRMHDFAHIFDGTEQPFFLDFVHLNEAGSRIAAEQIAPIVVPGLR
jgi:hypothetical protein